MSATPDSTLADPEQRIADLERQLAESNAERDEALEQQAATAEVLQVINSSPGDLGPVFDAMLEKATRLCDAAFGQLYTYEGETFAPAAVQGEAQFIEWLRQRGPWKPLADGHSPMARVVRGEHIVHIANVLNDESYHEADSSFPQHVDSGGIRSLLTVALRKDDALLGSMTVYRQEIRPFTDKQIALLQNFAAQAVIAMENARLITETREALEQQTATAEVLGVINSSPGDLAPVFDAILEKAHSFCGAAFGGLLIYDGDRFKAVALHNVPPAFAEIARQGFLATPPNPFARLLEGEPLVHIADLKEIAEVAPTGSLPRAGVDLAGIRTLLLVPLRKGDALLGVITAYRQEVCPFSDKQIALLQNFAVQAVIAIENARLITETREALEQQTATAEVLQVINSSPGDLAPVFEAMLEKAHSLCGADSGGLVLVEGNRYRAVAVHGEPSFAEYWLDLGWTPYPTGEDTLFGRLSRGEVVHLRDAAIDDGTRKSDQYHRLVELAGARSLVMVPLRKDDVLFGTITGFRNQVQPFSDKQIALLQNFAAQAVIAMENARLITETQEALEQQTATAEVLGVINSSPGDLAPVFDAMLEKAMHLCEAAFGLLVLFDGGTYRTVATRNLPEAFAAFLQGPQPISPNGSMARITRGESVVQIVDIATDEGRRAMITDGGARTTIWIALRKDAAALGCFNIYRQEVRPFTDKQIVLLQNFAAQAVIAMENARLITETREALEQQTATAEVLGVINSSPGDLAPVFDAMLEKAMRLCDAEFGILNTYDGSSFQRAAARGVPPAFEEWRLRQGPMPSGPRTLYGRITSGEKNVLHTLDLMAEDSYRDGDPDRRAFVELAGARTALVVALRKEETLLGTITIFRQEVRPFSDKQVALLQNFAAQAVIAIENARLITETREALEQQTATAEVLGVINSSPGELAPVFDAILEKALRLCSAAHGSLFTLVADTLHQVASVDATPQLVALRQQQGPNRIEPGTAFYPLLEGQGIVHLADVRESAAYRDFPAIRERLDAANARSMLAVALRKDEALLGVLDVYRQEVQPFSDKQIALLENFAAQAVIAMENARLITETREALEQQTATAEVLQVINASPGDLGPVFDAMLERAVRLCEFDFSTLWTFDGSAFHPAARHGVPEQFWQFLQGHTPPAFARLLTGERLVHISDLKQVSLYMESDFARELRQRGLEPPCSLLIVPMRKDDVLLGLIVAYGAEVRPFSDKQIALLENFAAQAVIAMENARLLGELRQRTEEVGELNRDLEARVAAQVDELSRVGRLKRFLAPQLAELIVSHGDEKILESHRREIVVVFCDLRGYTAFTETAEPEEVLDFLRQYHGALGPLVSQFEGTLDQFSGDGIMVFFNDPVPCADPAERAVNMAVAMRSAANTLIADWRERGRDLGFGAGIAQGYATLGQIGFSERSGYTAIGTVCNVAARLCAEAKDGQILLGQLVNVALKGSVATEQLGPLALKGLSQPVVAYNVPLGAIQPALRVIEGGPPSV